LYFGTELVILCVKLDPKIIFENKKKENKLHRKGKETMEERTSSTATVTVMEETKDEDDVWCRETVPKVLKLVCCSLSLNHADLVSLLFVSPFIYRTLLSSQSLWQVSLCLSLSLSLSLSFFLLSINSSFSSYY
jgi:hypothetical protein